MPIDIKPPMPRDLFLRGLVNENSIGDITRSIIDINTNDRELEKLHGIYSMVYSPQPIKIHIDTYGGYVYQMLGLIGVIEKSKTPVHTIAVGAAMSCGFIILVSGHRRFGYKYSNPMYHIVSAWKQGTIQDIKEDLVQTEILQDTLEKIVIKNTLITKKKLEKVRSRKFDWHMDANEALKLKVIDEIL